MLRLVPGRSLGANGFRFTARASSRAMAGSSTFVGAITPSRRGKSCSGRAGRPGCSCLQQESVSWSRHGGSIGSTGSGRLPGSVVVAVSCAKREVHDTSSPHLRLSSAVVYGSSCHASSGFLWPTRPLGAHSEAAWRCVPLSSLLRCVRGGRGGPNRPTASSGDVSWHPLLLVPLAPFRNRGPGRHAAPCPAASQGEARPPSTRGSACAVAGY